MEEYPSDENSRKEHDAFEEDELNSSEEAFLRGYLNEKEVQECAECGLSLDEISKSVKKELGGEELVFCSRSCAEDYKDSFL